MFFIVLAVDSRLSYVDNEKMEKSCSKIKPTRNATG